MKEYSDNELILTKKYEITTTCNGEDLGDNPEHNRYFLKIYKDNDENTSGCLYLDGFNYDGNGILSFMNDRGKEPFCGFW